MLPRAKPLVALFGRKCGFGFVGRRPIFGWTSWFDASFNKVDQERIKQVGIDRAAAEWILRCGGGVKWANGSVTIRDYNALPIGGRNFKIAEIDGTDSAIMEEGFQHLKNLEKLWKVNLYNNRYLTDASIGLLCSYTRDSLRWLRIGKSGNISDKGLHHIRVMEKLEYLRLEGLPEVENPRAALEELKEFLPNCKIEFPPHTQPEET